VSLMGYRGIVEGGLREKSRALAHAYERAWAGLHSRAGASPGDAVKGGADAVEEYD